MNTKHIRAGAFLIGAFLVGCSQDSETVKLQKPTDIAEIVKNIPTPNITVNVTGPTVSNNTNVTSTGGNSSSDSTGGNASTGAISNNSAGGSAQGGNATGGSNSNSISSGNSSATGTGGAGGNGGAGGASTSSAGNSTANANNSGTSTVSNTGSSSSNSSSTNNSTNSGSASNQANNSTNNNADNSNGVSQNTSQTNNQNQTNNQTQTIAYAPTRFPKLGSAFIEVDDSGKQNCNTTATLRYERGCHMIKLKHGMKCSVYDLKASPPQVMPNFSTLNPVGIISVDQLDVVDVDYAGSFPKFPVQLKYLLENYGLVCEGLFNASQDDTYTFYITSDDGSKLYIDNTLVVNNDGLHSTRAYQNSLFLAKGEHNVKVEYFQGPRTRISLVLEFSFTNNARQVIPSSLLRY